MVELRKRCKAAGLSAKGSMAQLINRLGELEGVVPCLESSASSGDDPTCVAILVTQTKISCEEEKIKIDAKDALGQALEDDDLEVEEVWGTAYVGNRRGLDLAPLRERFHMMEQRIAFHEARINHLDDRVTTLSLPFRSTDKFAQAGNVTAHGGDVITDALLYKGVGGRSDSKTFIELYGITPSDAQKIQHKETIEALNTHARVRADNHKKGSPEYYRRFQVFIDFFQKTECDTDYLRAVPPTTVTKAYGDLLNCAIYSDNA
ncbi:hypothetical protein HOY82DRAFT_669246 [Tuber indicum]|nr:hypothetical protein HOY82DRAFT_669246 [Tuber indicum]